MTIVLGLVTAAMGAFYVVAASGVIALGPEPAHEDPRWVSVLAGLILLLGGAAVVVRGVLGVDEQDPDGLPPSTPAWLRSIAQLLSLTIVVSLGAIFSWIAFGPGERTFAGTGAILGETVGRAMFGIFAGLVWLVLGVMAVSQLRRVLGGRRRAP